MSTRTEHAETRPMNDLVATLALFAYSLAVAAGFARVFGGWGFFDNLVMIAVVGHGLSAVLRYFKVTIWAALPITAAALIWIIAVMYYRDTMTLLVPSSETWSRFRLDLDVIGDDFKTAVAPVLFLGGWDVLASIGVAAAVLLSDTFAFRAYARAESLVPGGVLFVFVAALGDDRSRVASTMALVGTGVVATVILRQHHAPARAASIGASHVDHPTRALPLALGSALSIALIAGFIGPRLPGAGAEAIYETSGGNGGSVTEVISPLVDIRSRLTNRSTSELFVVQADTDSYWRISALAKFDGRTWGIPSRSLNRTDSIGVAAAGSVTIRQEIRINNLGGVLLPAAADPIAASGIGDLGDDLRISADGATLVKTGDKLVAGDTFLVESASPRFTTEALASATSSDPGDDIYLELPDDLPASVAKTAREVTDGATSTYEAARMVQDWMRTDFRYSLDIQEGHDNDAIESFLINKIGYCEQFAGTYAAMMRTLGIPSRVAVGFTPGTNDGTGTYSVLGRNAHAWPEVWFDGLGWVPFEPTPGRGAPNAEDYTDVEPQQAEAPVGGDQPGEGGPGQSAPPPTTVVGGGRPGPTASTVPAAPATTLPAAGAPAPGEPETGGPFPWQLPAIPLLIAAVIGAPALVRRIRRSAPSAPTVRLTALWHRATDALAEMGLDVSPDRTPTETAQATAGVFPVAMRPMQALAAVVTETTFSADGSAHLTDPASYGTLLDQCANWCRQVERAVSDSLTPTARIRRHFTVWQ